MTKGKLAVLAVIAALVAAFFIFDLRQYISLEYFKAQRAAIEAYRDSRPLQAAAAFFAVYVAVTGLSLPGAAVLTLVAGAVFGLLWGVVIVSFASTIGATLAFLASRYVLRDWVQEKFGDKLKTINDGVAREGAFYLFALRLVPAFPFFMINVVMGLTSMRIWTYFWVSQLGMFLGTIVYVYAGTQLGEFRISAGLIAAFVLLGIFPLIAKKVLEAFKARRVYSGWKRPARYDNNIVVIGGGSAGLVTAYIAAAVKAKVTLIEKHRMGGDCLNTGCVPSKALIATTKLLAQMRRSKEYGIRSASADFDFADVMERVARVVSEVEPHDSVERYTKLGVECVQATARITSPWTVEATLADGSRRTLTTRNIVIAAGGSPFVPPIPGLRECMPLTSDTVWDLRVQPRRMVVLGGGPIGCELAQCFARLGTKVTQVEMLPRILACDEILCAVGRAANVEGYGLEELGIPVTKQKTVEVNEFLQARFPNIFACGDVAGPYQFTHTASHMAWYCAVNALFGRFRRFRVDWSVVPWATFTDPVVARVGLNESEAREKKIAVEVHTYGLDDLDRAIADGEAHGLLKVLTRRGGKGEILGATIAGEHADDLIAELVLAMKHRVGLNQILGTIHAYPTLPEANKYVAGAWKRSHVTQGQMAFARTFNDWTRGETGLAAVLGKLLSLTDKRPYYEIAESHGDE